MLGGVRMGVPRTGEAVQGGEGWGMRECDAGEAPELLIYNFLVLDRATNRVCDLSGDCTTLVNRKKKAPSHPSLSKSSPTPSIQHRVQGLQWHDAR